MFVVVTGLCLAGETRFEHATSGFGVHLYGLDSFPRNPESFDLIGFTAIVSLS
jgi:hypothetical protein